MCVCIFVVLLFAVVFLCSCLVCAFCFVCFVVVCVFCCLHFCFVLFVLCLGVFYGEPALHRLYSTEDTRKCNSPMTLVRKWTVDLSCECELLVPFSLLLIYARMWLSPYHQWRHTQQAGNHPGKTKIRDSKCNTSTYSGIASTHWHLSRYSRSVYREISSTVISV